VPPAVGAAPPGEGAAVPGTAGAGAAPAGAAGIGVPAGGKLGGIPFIKNSTAKGWNFMQGGSTGTQKWGNKAVRGNGALSKTELEDFPAQI